jgi:hypothetical protein
MALLPLVCGRVPGLAPALDAERLRRVQHERARRSFARRVADERATKAAVEARLPRVVPDQEVGADHLRLGAAGEVARSVQGRQEQPGPRRGAHLGTAGRHLRDQPVTIPGQGQRGDGGARLGHFDGGADRDEDQVKVRQGSAEQVGPLVVHRFNLRHGSGDFDTVARGAVAHCPAILVVCSTSPEESPW